MDDKRKQKFSHRFEKFNKDAFIPNYHFYIPGLGFPADPNAPFYYQGIYHLFYIYKNPTDSYRWGHAISKDLLHWSFKKDALIPDEKDGGIYSGGVLLEKDIVYLVYWALGNKNAGGIRIAKSIDKTFENFEKQEGYVIQNDTLGIANILDSQGKKIEIGAADPSNIFKDDDTYYVVCGNLDLLNKYRDTNHKSMLGDHAYLFESKDLKTWNYVHEFYERHQDNGFTDESEDCMCPYFGALPDKDGKKSNRYLFLFLAHNKGSQYYIGDFDKENKKFIIESHGRLSFVDNNLFAPEAMLLPDGRMLSFYWLRDNQDDDLKREEQKGWSGIHSLPRQLYLNEKNQLKMRPLQEIKQLRKPIITKRKITELSVLNKEQFDTDCCEIVIKNINKSMLCNVGITIDLAGQGFVYIYLDLTRNKLVFDLTKSNSLGRKVFDEAPLDLTDRETLFLDIFIDKCVIEVFACNQQAISRQVFDLQPNNRKISFMHAINDTSFVDVYEIMPTNCF